MWQIVLVLVMVRVGGSSECTDWQMTISNPNVRSETRLAQWQTHTICPSLTVMNIHRQEMRISLTNKECGSLRALDITNNMTFQWIFISNYHKSLYFERSAKRRCGQNFVMQKICLRGHIIIMISMLEFIYLALFSCFTLCGIQFPFAAVNGEITSYNCKVNRKKFFNRVFNR